MDSAERLYCYRDLCRRVNRFFADHVADYCRHCQQVMDRVPGGGMAYELRSGVFPGCCHRGAGDIFRLEGVTDPSRLADGLVDLLQVERQKVVAARRTSAATYELISRETGARLHGEHCRYFGAEGCLLGDLKGPLCINFICPPIRADLLQVVDGDESVIGPEYDFLWIYQTLAAISAGGRPEIEDQLLVLDQHLERLTQACRHYLEAAAEYSLFACFCCGAADRG
ncbi:MAG: hypothetical protein JXO49_04370 [Deltaproteobacteria bacterium]|nr:hypothetical protein [Candidatus Anaeroferrophillus wilburensis]MBN2888564.1 hypothetical protein [Deltaproteobacteria bacterium]